jgi:PEP-CTERM motif
MAKQTILIVAMLFLPVLAKADSVWTYQGNAVSAPGFLSGDGPLTGTVLLNDNNQVEAWSFFATSGGYISLTNFNTTDASFNLFACASCAGTPFKGWSISLDNFSATTFPGAVLNSSWNPDTGVGGDFVTNHAGDLGEVNVTNNPGVWTEVVSTPEPGSLLLLGAGITALALAISLQKSLA